MHKVLRIEFFVDRDRHQAVVPEHAATCCEEYDAIIISRVTAMINKDDVRAMTRNPQSDHRDAE